MHSSPGRCHVRSRSTSTVEGWLVEWIEATAALSASPWVSDDRVALVVETASKLDGERLKPVFDALGGQVSYLEIRVALAVHANGA